MRRATGRAFGLESASRARWQGDVSLTDCNSNGGKLVMRFVVFEPFLQRIKAGHLRSTMPTCGIARSSSDWHLQSNQGEPPSRTRMLVATLAPSQLPEVNKLGAQLPSAVAPGPLCFCSALPCSSVDGGGAAGICCQGPSSLLLRLSGRPVACIRRLWTTMRRTGRGSNASVPLDVAICSPIVDTTRLAPRRASLAIQTLTRFTTSRGCRRGHRPGRPAARHRASLAATTCGRF
jgi:hypothetical protein